MPLTGYVMKGDCFDTLVEAQFQFASDFPHLDTQYFTYIYSLVTSVDSRGFPSLNVDLESVSLTNPNQAAVHRIENFGLIRCDPTLNDTSTVFFMDGMEMGWGVVAAMAAALAVIFIKKSFFR